MRNTLVLFLLVFMFSCKNKTQTTKPQYQSITESVYASGIVKAKDQYSVFANVNGVIDQILVDEGDVVKKGTPLLTISNVAQKLSRENAELAANFADLKSNGDKLQDAKSFMNLAKSKLDIDSALYVRQRNLWDQKIGTQVEFEQRELNYKASKNSYSSAVIKYNDLKKQLQFNANQSQNNMLISKEMEDNFTIKSEVNGLVYKLNKVKGEAVSPQVAIAVVGDSSDFVLEMQIDEYDILKVKLGLKVIVTLNTYAGQTYEAVVSKIDPWMNERSKTFLVEAKFTKRPKVLYPNLSFEANIVCETKAKALLIPRTFVFKGDRVIKASGDTIKITTSLKDYEMIEVLNGLNESDELIKP